ncbi:hypothetical protein MTP04_24230 [Lysinibacillus sp. PLM2]|nr:hypothetical protein MTP04_24230 [Lysinibacillus sp. PLM2]
MERYFMDPETNEVKTENEWIIENVEGAIRSWREGNDKQFYNNVGQMIMDWIPNSTLGLYEVKK